MVRKDDTLDAVLVGQDGVFDSLDAFNYYWEFGQAADPVQDVPVDEGRDSASPGFGDTCTAGLIVAGLNC